MNRAATPNRCPDLAVRETPVDTTGVDAAGRKRALTAKFRLNDCGRRLSGKSRNAPGVRRSV
jgi:hypothetical protein